MTTSQNAPASEVEELGQNYEITINGPELDALQEIRSRMQSGPSEPLHSRPNEDLEASILQRLAGEAIHALLDAMDAEEWQAVFPVVRLAAVPGLSRHAERAMMSLPFGRFNREDSHRAERLRDSGKQVRTATLSKLKRAGRGDPTRIALAVDLLDREQTLSLEDLETRIATKLRGAAYFEAEAKRKAVWEETVKTGF